MKLQLLLDYPQTLLFDSIVSNSDHNTTFSTTMLDLLPTTIAITNSAFAVDCATVSSFLVLREKTLDPRLKQYSKVLFMSSTKPPQSLIKKSQ